MIVYVAHIDGLGDNDWQEVHPDASAAWTSAHDFLVDLWGEELQDDPTELVLAVENAGGYLTVDAHTVIEPATPKGKHYVDMYGDIPATDLYEEDCEPGDDPTTCGKCGNPIEAEANHG